MEAILTTLQTLPPDVNRYEFLLDYIKPAPSMSVVFHRNLKAILGLAIITVVLCIAGLAGKLYYKTSFLFKLVNISHGGGGKILAFDTMSLWMFFILSFSAMTIPLTFLARSAYLHDDLNALLRFERLFFHMWMPLWTAGWVVTYGVLVASLVVLAPIWHLPRMSPTFYSIVGLFIPFSHWIVITVVAELAHSETIQVIKHFKSAAVVLEGLAAQGTGYPDLKGLMNPSLVATLSQLAEHSAKRQHKERTCDSVRLAYQGILFFFLLPASFIYLDSLRKQIFVVLPRLRGQVTRRTTLMTDREERPQLIQQGRYLRELAFSYFLMLLEHVGIMVLICCYTVNLGLLVSNEHGLMRSGSFFNAIFASLLYFTFSISPFVQLFQAVRAWRPGQFRPRGGSLGQGSSAAPVTHAIRVDTVAEVLVLQIPQDDYELHYSPRKEEKVIEGVAAPPVYLPSHWD